MDGELILNRYRPIAEAGSGGFGTVVAAWDTRIQRRVAIKQMKLDTDKDAGGHGVAAAGLEEARTAAMLQDQSIVGVLDFEVQGDTAYLIMEYVDGITLTKLMRDYGDHMNPDIVAAVFQGVAHALQVAHSNQVLHLDIKPDNILITRQGTIKVTDFGLAKLSDAAGFSHAGGGTIGYMPLEQMRLEPLDARCDEWSLASITYQMISGENPFLAKDLSGAEAAIDNAELVLPSLCMNLDQNVDDVLFYALDPDREERYATVADFAEELQPFLGSVQRGRKQLARIVGQASEDEPQEPQEHYQVEQRERKPMKNWHIFLRLWGALAAGVLGFVGLANVVWLDATQALAFWGIEAGIVIVALAFPPAGMTLAAGAVVAALVSHGFYFLAGVLGVATVLWLVFAGRFSFGAADASGSPVLFGAVGAGQATPFLLGYFMDVRDAVVSALWCSILAVYLAALGSESVLEWWPHVNYLGMDAGYPSRMLGVLHDPTTWILLAAWIAATAVMSALCSRVGRGFAVLGSLLAGCVLVLGLAAATFVTSGFTAYIPSMMSLGIVAACTLGSVIVCLAREPQ